ncbi:MAG TPA: NAD(P)/FAD-dependent oxidoreductase, partial [Clostridia bacterium]|nr:NAD(P)/FAD-dependent oxidoreductase [Clostridia bacterium]
MKSYDAVIIGRGPAGISASLYLSRANLSTLMLGTDQSALRKASEIENYFGFEGVMSGSALLDAGEKQAQRLGVEIRQEEVVALGPAETGFDIQTVSGGYAAKAVLIATGQPSRKASIPGLQDFEGKGVSYCTTCDGFFYRNKSVGVLGNGNYAVQEAMELEPFTKDITIFTNGSELSVTGEFAQRLEKYDVIQKPVIRLVGEEKLGELILEDGPKKLDGLFIAFGTASSVDFAVKLGVNVRDNAILVDERQMTNFDGIFAAGDCTGGFKQISTAVGQGALAGRGM